MVEAVDAHQRGPEVVLVPRVAAHLGGLAGKTIAVWGLAFKPRTDDMREAPAIAIIEGAARGRRRGAGLRPEGGGRRPRRLFGDRITLCARAYEAVAGADALVVVTEWNEFREPDFAQDPLADAAARRSSTAATSTTRGCCASWASTTRGSAGGERAGRAIRPRRTPLRGPAADAS